MNFNQKSDLHFYVSGRGNSLKAPLSCPIELQESLCYEICLNRMVYGKKFKNIYKSEIFYHSFESRSVQKASIENKYYKDEQEFTSAFNKIFSGMDAQMYTLEYRNERFILSLKTTGSDPPLISFSSDIQAFCGLENTYKMQGVHMNSKTPSRLGDNYMVKVYCSQIQNVNVDSETQPLLCSFPFGANLECSEYYVYEPSRPIYTPLLNHNLDCISIEIRNAKGDLFPFENFDLINTTLHCRPNLPNL